VGGPEDGDADAHRRNGRGSSALRRGFELTGEERLRVRTKFLRRSKTFCQELRPALCELEAENSQILIAKRNAKISNQKPKTTPCGPREYLCLGS
jgi:hypothetical protein